METLLEGGSYTYKAYTIFNAVRSTVPTKQEIEPRPIFRVCCQRASNCTCSPTSACDDGL